MSDIKKNLYTTINNSTIEDKDTFIWLLYQEFPNDQNDLMLIEQVNIQLSMLSQKNNEDFYTYYSWIDILFIRIFWRNYITHNRENIIILNNIEQYIFKDTITNLCFDLKITKLHLYIIEYSVDPIYSFYRVFKKLEVYLDELNAKAQM